MRKAEGSWDGFSTVEVVTWCALNSREALIHYACLDVQAVVPGLNADNGYASALQIVGGIQ